MDLLVNKIQTSKSEVKGLPLMMDLTIGLKFGLNLKNSAVLAWKNLLLAKLEQSNTKRLIGTIKLLI